jgi:hypothetical protein
MNVEMIDKNIASGVPLTLAAAAKTLPRINGRKVHTSTLWRWCRKGYNGIRLEYFRMGRTIMTSEFLLQKFFTELAKADSVQTSQSQFQPRRKRRISPQHRQKSIDEANEILRKAKIIV